MHSIILSVLIFISQASSVTLDNSIWVEESTSYQETKCEICSKTIYEEVDMTVDFSGTTLMWNGSGYSEGEEASYISVELTIMVCDGCESLYEKELKKLVRAFWDKKVLEWQLENAKNIKKHIEERKLKDLAMLKKLILDLERKLNLLEKELKE